MNPVAAAVLCMAATAVACAPVWVQIVFDAFHPIDPTPAPRRAPRPPAPGGPADRSTMATTQTSSPTPPPAPVLTAPETAKAARDLLRERDLDEQCRYPTEVRHVGHGRVVVNIAAEDLDRLTNSDRYR